VNSDLEGELGPLVGGVCSVDPDLAAALEQLEHRPAGAVEHAHEALAVQHSGDQVDAPQPQAALAGIVDELDVPAGLRRQGPRPRRRRSSRDAPDCPRLKWASTVSGLSRPWS
jgi:hypothetical protein